MFETVVIGGGPAGLSAATWLGRYRRKTLVLDSGEYRNRWIERVHDLLGHDPVAPEDVLRTARQNLGQYPHVELRSGLVSHCRRWRGRRSSSGARRRCPRRLPGRAGFAEHYGHDIFHCRPATDSTPAASAWRFSVGTLTSLASRWSSPTGRARSGSSSTAEISTSRRTIAADSRLRASRSDCSRVCLDTFGL